MLASLAQAISEALSETGPEEIHLDWSLTPGPEDNAEVSAWWSGGLSTHPGANCFIGAPDETWEKLGRGGATDDTRENAFALVSRCFTRAVAEHFGAPQAESVGAFVAVCAAVDVSADAQRRIDHLFGFCKAVVPAVIDLADEVDYCIIGSGAAGGVLAYRLGAAIEKDSSICVLERGAYNSPLQDFSDDELRMIRMLYTEGGLQMSRTFYFTIPVTLSSQ